MEFLVEFDLTIPAETSVSEVDRREAAEASAAAQLSHEGHLLRVWTLPTRGEDSPILGLYRADNLAEPRSPPHCLAAV